ncbi:MAG: hypothetical protein ABIJ09_25515 [Pseudomonadota bacterium]
MGAGFSLIRLEPMQRMALHDLPPETATRSRILAALARTDNPVLRASLGSGHDGGPARIIVHDVASTDVLRRLRERARRLGARCEVQRDLAWIQVADLDGSQQAAALCNEALVRNQISPIELEISPRGFALLVEQHSSQLASTLCFEVLEGLAGARP